MARAVAFSRSIKDSEKFARLFTDIVDQHIQSHEPTNRDQDDAGTASDRLLRCEAKHVDGTFNVLRRNERLDWLKEALGGVERPRLLADLRPAPPSAAISA